MGAKMPSQYDVKELWLQCDLASTESVTGAGGWAHALQLIRIALSTWLPTPVSLPGESHGQKSLAGCSPRGYKEPDTTGWLALSHSCWSQFPGCFSRGQLPMCDQPTETQNWQVNPHLAFCVAPLLAVCPCANYITSLPQAPPPQNGYDTLWGVNKLNIGSVLRVDTTMSNA